MDSHQHPDIGTLVPAWVVWGYLANQWVSFPGFPGLVRAQTLSLHYMVGRCSGVAQSGQKRFWQAIEQVYRVNRCMRLNVAGIPPSRRHWELRAKHGESRHLCGGVNRLAHGFVDPLVPPKMKALGIEPVIAFGASGI